MNALHIALAVAAIVALGGVLCRLFALDHRQHRWGVIAMHGGLAVACLWAVVESLSGRATAGDVGAVIGTLAWLGLSLSTWRSGPPPHARKGA